MKSAVAVAALSLALAPAAFAANSITVVTPGLNSTGHTMQVNLDDTSNNVFVETQHPNAETHYRMRFWVNPSGLSALAPNTAVRIGAINSSTFGQRIVLFLRHDAPGTPAQYQVNVWGLQDPGAPASYSFINGVNIGPVAGAVPNQVEVEWTRSTGAGNADGIIRIQRITPGNTGIDQVRNDLIMHDFTVDDARFGLLAGSGTNMTGPGNYKFDEFESYR